jgi:hypothetical protein
LRAIPRDGSSQLTVHSSILPIFVGTGAEYGDRARAVWDKEVSVAPDDCAGTTMCSML